MRHMRTRRFPRRVEIAAIALAVVMTFALSPRASADNALTAHGFTDGFTDIPFSAVGDVLQMGFQPNAPRYLFDHDGPISYNPNTQLLSVQSFAGFAVDSAASGLIGRTNITAFVDNNGVLVNDVAMYSCGGGAPASFCVQASDGSVLLSGQVKGFAYRYNAGTKIDPERAQSYDDFAFYIKITGGSAAGSAGYGSYLAVSVHSFTFAWTGPAFQG